MVECLWSVYPLLQVIRGGEYLQGLRSHDQLCMILEGLLTTLVLFPGSFSGLGARPMNGVAA
jgi:hypothetical protein